MSFSLVISDSKSEYNIMSEGKDSFLTLLRSLSLPVTAPCGGHGKCGKCAVTVSGIVRRISTGDIETVENAVISSCCYAPAGDCRVSFIRDAGEVVSGAPKNIPTGGEGLGLAVDIGTTTVAAALYDLKIGDLLAEVKALNAQRSFGSDVISRIEYSNRYGCERLSSVLHEQISELAKDAARKCGRNAGEITKLVIAANTIMEHYAAGLDPASIAVAPYTPQELFGCVWEKSDLSRLFPDCEIYFCPCVSGYVGGDICAGLSTLDEAFFSGLWCYIDVGTNGEIVLGDGTRMLCCAAAAGPAFEGAELSCGMSASEGAIDRVRINNGEVSCHVIGGGEARGICGSGVIDAISALYSAGVIIPSGRFAADSSMSQRLSGSGVEQALALTDKVSISIGDIQSIQYAKSAVRAGTETLLAEYGEGTTPEKLCIAGGFGQYISIENAINIGLFPDVGIKNVSYCGNASLTGAALALSEGHRAKLRALRERMEYIELSGSQRFSDEYLDNLYF